MTVRRDKRVKRRRGGTTHGWGSMKKHRGSGNRGGRGLAGSGKRAGHKVHFFMKKFGKGYLGKKGFTIKYKPIKINPVNLSYVEQNLDKYIKNGNAKKEGDFLCIDLSNLGYNKLLGTGRVNQKLKIKVKFYSKKAKEKIEKIGGEIVTG